MAAPAEGQEGIRRVELRFPPAPRTQSASSSVVELVIVLALALGLTWVVQQYVVRSYGIPTGSMRTTIDEGDRVLAARFLTWFSDPERGDVILFHPPGSGNVARRYSQGEAKVTYIKRVVGLPGETVEGLGNRVLICRAPRVACHVLHEPYAHGVTSDFGPIVVPRDSYFTLGDNRQSSGDSRFWGTLPRRNIIGPAIVRYWPLGRIGIL
jgi:signal peptidase I